MIYKSLRRQSNQVKFVDYNDIILRSYTNKVIFIIHFVGKLLCDFVKVVNDFVKITYEVIFSFVNEVYSVEHFIDYDGLIVTLSCCVTWFSADRRTFVFLLLLLELMFTPVGSSSWTWAHPRSYHLLYVCWFNYFFYV